LLAYFYIHRKLHSTNIFTVDYDDPNDSTVQSRYWLPYNFSLCRDGSSTINLEKAWVVTDPNLNYIVLCPEVLTAIPAIRGNGDREKDFSLDPMANVETLMQYISATIFHMLLHVYFRPDSESIILSFLFLSYLLD
jgi:hypothetical protein